MSRINMETSRKAFIQGGFTALASVYVAGKNVNLKLDRFGLQNEFPLYIASFVIGGVSSFVVDAISEITHPEIQPHQRHMDNSSMVSGALISALVFNGALWMANPAIPAEYGYLNSSLVAGLGDVGSGVLSMSMSQFMS